MNSFGRLFRVSIFGESHGNSVGVLLDGVKPGLDLSAIDFTAELNKRKPGAVGTTKRIETDEPHFMSGVFNGKTTGAPILITFDNNNTRSKDYSQFVATPRPGHADFTYNKKYNGFNDYRGGGPSSGRLTVGLVCAGAIAKHLLGLDISSEIIKLGKSTNKEEYSKIIKEATMAGNSVGGTVRLTVKNQYIGLGEPFFDSLESTISHAMFSVGAVKGISFGLYDEEMTGREFNDPFINENGKTATNNNGGINGGISNGNDIIVNVYVKPTASIFQEQSTYNFKTNKMENLKILGRHDSAIILRAKVVLEAMLAIALYDSYLVNKSINE